MKLSKKIYWALSLTWGLILTLLGLTTTLVLVSNGYKMRRNIYGWYIEIDGNFGGLSLGPFTIVSAHPSRSLLNHEFGHSIQNCYLGPLFPFVVAIPSAIRYWYRELTPNKLHPDYDAIWFEGTATRLGYKYYEAQNI